MDLPAARPWSCPNFLDAAGFGASTVLLGAGRAPVLGKSLSSADEPHSGRACLNPTLSCCGSFSSPGPA